MNTIEKCLNPCSNGMALEHMKKVNVDEKTRVLILVLMEWRWNLLITLFYYYEVGVLILVLMEWRWNITYKT